MRQLFDFLRKLLGLDDPGARRALGEAGVAEQRLGLRAPQQPVRRMMPVERLFAESIARDFSPAVSAFLETM